MGACEFEGSPDEEPMSVPPTADAEMEEEMRLRRSRPLVGWALLGMLLAGCAINGDTGEIPQNILDPSPGTTAQQVDRLWNQVFPIAIGVFVLVQGLILYALWRFRSKGDDEPIPKQVAGNTRLELTWTVIPAVILAFVAVPTVQTIFSLSAEGPDVINVRVIGKQYFWEFEYMDPEEQAVVTATELHIPAGREVQLDLVSASATVSFDPNTSPGGFPTGEQALGVLHNFSVPKLAPKTYLYPNRVREMALIAEEEGVYLGQCMEFCGLSHPNMRFSVIVQSQEDFDAWIAEQAEPADAVEQGDSVDGQTGDPAVGQDLFASRQCIGCHAIEGHPATLTDDGEQGQLARTGPNLTHLNSRDTFAGGILDVQSDDDMLAWLRNPQEQKPGAQMPRNLLAEDELDDILAYLRTLD
jgi:cytochrome c oxidase subunit 2